MAIVRNTIKFSSGGGGSDITVVANYSALPDPTTVSGQFYWCSASQGTSWLPGSLGGTYYNSGMYYSNGTTWEFLNVPYNATQSEVNTGTNNDKFVTPKTFTDASKWNDFLAKSTIVSSNTTASNDANYTVVANATFTDPSPIEGKGYITYVRNGTATIGGVGYGVGKLIYRTFHSGSWNTVIFIDQTALDAKVEDAIVNGVTDKAPSQNAVFDAIANASSTFKTLPADVTTTLATAQAITALNHSLDANSTYIVRGNLRLGCSGAGGVKLAVTYPASTIAVIQAVGQGANITSSTWVNHSNASSGVLQNAVSTSNTVAGTYIMNGTIKTGGTAGNLIFSFASTTAGQTSNVYTDGSFIEIIKIS
jgi:hypothetical protein